MSEIHFSLFSPLPLKKLLAIHKLFTMKQDREYGGSQLTKALLKEQSYLKGIMEWGGEGELSRWNTICVSVAPCG